MDQKKKWRFVHFVMSFGFLITLSTFMLDACGAFGTVSRHWEEEVKLHDGRKIVVDRVVEVERCCGENFKNGDTISQKIIFRSESGRIVWEDDIAPIIFDIVGTTYYVVADPMSMDECIKHSDPNPPFIFYKYKNGKWEQIKNSEFPDGFQTNLLADYWGDRTGKGEKISAEEKPKLNSYANNKVGKFLGHFNKDLNQPCAL